MNKVLVVSDNHGLTEELTVIKERHQLKYMIHCGDSELDMDVPELDGFIKVAGNCDHDNRLPDEQTITIGEFTILIVHGHLHGVQTDLGRLSYRADEVGAQIVCFGHTHVAGAEKINNRLFVNPGSIRLPRRRFEKTYAIIEWDTEEAIRVNFYTLTGEHVHDLSYHVNLHESL